MSLNKRERELISESIQEYRKIIKHLQEQIERLEKVKEKNEADR